MSILKDITMEEYDKYKVLHILNLNGSNVKVGKVIFNSDARVPINGLTNHEEDEYVCIVKGNIIFGTEESEYVLHEGDFHFMPRGKKHWCQGEAGKDSELLFIMLS